jgi:hypothetical protein
MVPLLPPSYVLGVRTETEPKEEAMITKRAGEAAKVGFYFNTRTWEIDLHRKDGGALPGGDRDLYVRVPALALIFLGPFIGFVFVIFLPFIGFALVTRELGHRAARGFGLKADTSKTPKPSAR